MSLYRQSELELKRLENELIKVKSELRELPDGSLQIHNRKAGDSYVQEFYRNLNNDVEYLGKGQSALCIALTRKRYLEAVESDILGEINAIRRYQKSHRDDESCQVTKFLNNPGFSEFVLQSHLNPDIELRNWQNADYDKLNYRPEELIHPSKSGKKFRSKSEASIDSALFDYGIYSRYEAALTLPTGTYYPDFTIRSSKNPDKIVYWEHFGMMDIPSYQRRTGDKLNMYYRNGLIPSVNFIATYETKQTPLDVNYVDFLIKLYFC